MAVPVDDHHPARAKGAGTAAWGEARDVGSRFGCCERGVSVDT